MADPIVLPGTVESSGENPGVSLKEAPDGPFIVLASFFRIVLPPHGRGHALMLLQSPQDINPPAERANFCFYDKEMLARYLVADFVSHSGAFKGRRISAAWSTGGSTASRTRAIRLAATARR